MNQQPHAIGTVVLSAWDVPAVDLKVSRAYTIAERVERPMYPGGKVVWFYRMEGFARCNVYHDFVKPAQGIVRPPA